MANDPTHSGSGGPWRGLLGGAIDHLYVGAHVIDQQHGIRGQIERLVDDGWVELRLDDGGSRRVRLRPATPVR
jgi:hypothetical protein